MKTNGQKLVTASGRTLRGRQNCAAPAPTVASGELAQLIELARTPGLLDALRELLRQQKEGNEYHTYQRKPKRNASGQPEPRHVPAQRSTTRIAGDGLRDYQPPAPKPAPQPVYRKPSYEGQNGMVKDDAPRPRRRERSNGDVITEARNLLYSQAEVPADGEYHTYQRRHKP